MEQQKGRWTAAAGLLVICALAHSSAAQVSEQPTREGVWLLSLPDALSAARYSGRGVLIFFQEDWCGYCERLEQVILHRDIRNAVRRFILVKSKMDEDDALARRYKVNMHHQVVMLDWTGKVIGKIDGFKSVRDVALRIIEGAAANDLNAADKLVRLGYYGKAADRLRIVVKISHDEGRLAEAQKQLEEIGGRSERQLALIRQLVKAERLAEAADACTEFIDDYPADMGGDEAKRVLARIKAGRPVSFPDETPAAEDDKPQSVTADEARGLLERGMVHEWDRRFYDAVMSYQKVTTLAPDSDVAAEAKRRLKLLLEDPEMRTLITRQKMEKFCTRQLEMGQMYERNGRDDVALRYYRGVITTYPESAYAAEAAKRIEAIEGRRKKNADR